jgi:DNA-binding NtrC family response regulator
VGLRPLATTNHSATHSATPPAASTAPAEALASAPNAIGIEGERDPFRAESFEAFKEQSEALFIARKLAENGGNVKRTAERLGMMRSHLYKKLDRYGLR